MTKQENSDITLSVEGKSSQKKTVHFLLGEDGEPWVRFLILYFIKFLSNCVFMFSLCLQVWVLGENESDKSIEQILEEEALQKAHSQALKETEELRKSVEKELGDLIEYNSEQMDSMEKVFFTFVCITLTNLLESICFYWKMFLY